MDKKLKTALEKGEATVIHGFTWVNPSISHVKTVRNKNVFVDLDVQEIPFLAKKYKSHSRYYQQIPVEQIEDMLSKIKGELEDGWTVHKNQPTRKYRLIYKKGVKPEERSCGDVIGIMETKKDEFPTCRD